MAENKLKNDGQISEISEMSLLHQAIRPAGAPIWKFYFNFNNYILLLIASQLAPEAGVLPILFKLLNQVGTPGLLPISLTGSTVGQLTGSSVDKGFKFSPLYPCELSKLITITLGSRQCKKIIKKSLMLHVVKG